MGPTCRRNPQRGSAATNEPEKLSALGEATTPGNAAPSETGSTSPNFAGPGSAVPASVAPGPAPTVMYSEVDLQRLLRIFKGVKEPCTEKPCERPLKARFPDLYTHSLLALMLEHLSGSEEVIIVMRGHL